MQKAGIDTGTIFYILIAVVAAITSIVQKKKKTDTNGSGPQGTPKRTWEEVLTDTYDIPDTKPVPSPQPVTKPAHRTVEQIHKTESTFITSKSHTERIVNEGVTASFEDFDIKSGEIGSSTENISRSKIDFDLRKAVIYSEVLNRKY
jgi:hypothetical protein